MQPHRIDLSGGNQGAARTPNRLTQKGGTVNGEREVEDKGAGGMRSWGAMFSMQEYLLLIAACSQSSRSRAIRRVFEHSGKIKIYNVG